MTTLNTKNYRGDNNTIQINLSPKVFYSFVEQSPKNIESKLTCIVTALCTNVVCSVPLYKQWIAT